MTWASDTATMYRRKQIVKMVMLTRQKADSPKVEFSAPLLHAVRRHGLPIHGQ